MIKLLLYVGGGGGNIVQDARAAVLIVATGLMGGDNLIQHINNDECKTCILYDLETIRRYTRQ